MIKIDFEFETQYGMFKDALYLPDDHGYNETQLQALKQERLDNWIAIIENPPVEEAIEEMGE